MKLLGGAWSKGDFIAFGILLATIVGIWIAHRDSQPSPEPRPSTDDLRVFVRAQDGRIITEGGVVLESGGYSGEERRIGPDGTVLFPHAAEGLKDKDVEVLPKIEGYPEKVVTVHISEDRANLVLMDTFTLTVFVSDAETRQMITGGILALFLSGAIAEDDEPIVSGYAKFQNVPRRFVGNPVRLSTRVAGYPSEWRIETVPKNAEITLGIKKEAHVRASLNPPIEQSSKKHQAKRNSSDQMTVMKQSSHDETVASPRPSPSGPKIETDQIANPFLSKEGCDFPEYNTVLKVSGGDGKYSWSLVEGKLIDGVTLDKEGEVHGHPRFLETQEFKLQVKDESGAIDTKKYKMTVLLPIFVPETNQRGGTPASLLLSQAQHWSCLREHAPHYTFVQDKECSVATLRCRPGTCSGIPFTLELLIGSSSVWTYGVNRNTLSNAGNEICDPENDYGLEGSFEGISSHFRRR